MDEGKHALLRRDATALTAELELLDRILRVSQLQHGRALYYHRLRGARKQLAAALSRCAETPLAAKDGPKAACAAITCALDAIPPAWSKLRQILAQTYFMPFALSCMAILARSAKLLSHVHAILCGGLPDGVHSAAYSKLLALTPVASNGLSRGLGRDSSCAHDPLPSSAVGTNRNEHGKCAAMSHSAAAVGVQSCGDSDDLGVAFPDDEDDGDDEVDVGEPTVISPTDGSEAADSFFFIDPNPAAPPATSTELKVQPQPAQFAPVTTQDSPEKRERKQPSARDECGGEDEGLKPQSRKRQKSQAGGYTRMMGMASLVHAHVERWAESRPPARHFARHSPKG